MTVEDDLAEVDYAVSRILEAREEGLLCVTRQFCFARAITAAPSRSNSRGATYRSLSLAA